MHAAYAPNRPGEDWRARREALGLSQVDLAHRAGVDPSTIWRLEHDRTVSEPVRRLVAAALGETIFAPLEGVA